MRSLFRAYMYALAIVVPFIAGIGCKNESSTTRYEAVKNKNQSESTYRRSYRLMNQGCVAEQEVVGTNPEEVGRKICERGG
ncbi:MAG: hypothetical protein HC902_01800 [Calothrix sp. SM1_5_4]|nr:hypothetical protein [Calothrix sp. SM1_5_4]